MRLRHLKLENITSLKGVHIIDFDRINQLSELFAITGPTGSGKSSILTAVSMAIYGDHPKGLTAADIVTVGEEHGEINLTFSKGNDIYEIRWNCKVLKKNGEPRKSPLTVRVVTRNGTPIEEELADLIGLDYDQFSKVVILNQGQFSDFLNSTFTQRKDLLENILNHHNLKSLAPFLKKRLKEIDSLIEQKEGQGELTRLMEEDEVREVEIKLIELKDDLKVKSIELPLIEESLKITKELRDLSLKNNKAYISLKEDEKHIESLLEDLTKEKQLSKNHNNELNKFAKQLKEFKPKIERSKKLVQEQKNLENDNIKINEKLKANAIKAEDLIAEQLLNKKKQDEIQKAIEELTSKIDIRILNFLSETEEDILVNKLNEQKSLNDRIIIQSNTFNNSLEQVRRIESEAKEKKAELIAIKDTIKQMNFSNKSINIIEFYDCLIEGKEDQQETLKKLKSLFQEELDYIRDFERKKDSLILLKENNEKIKKDINFNQEIIQKNSNSIGELHKEVADLIRKTDSLKDKIELEEKGLKGVNYLSLAFDIIKEENLDDCPVCKAPLKEQQIAQITSFLKETNVEEIKNNIRQNKDKFAEASKREASKTGQINTLEAELKQRQIKLNDLREIETTSSNEIKSIEEVLEKTSHLNEEESVKISRISLQIENILSDIHKLRQEWITSNAKYQRHERELNELKSSLEEGIGFLKTIYTDISKENFLEYFNEITEHLNLYRKKELHKSSLDGVNQVISKIKVQIEENEAQKESLTSEHENIAKEITSIQNEFQIEELPPNPFEQEEELLNQEKVLKTEQERINGVILEKEVAYEKKNAQINLVKEQIESTKELLSLYRSNLSSLIEKTSKILNHKDLIKGLNKTLQSNLQNEAEISSLSSFIDGLLISLLQSYRADIKEIETNLIVFETQLKENEKQLDKIRTIKEAIKKLRKSKEVYERLSPYLLKDAFRDFALEFLEEGLLQLANFEIESLADGRYELIHGKAGKRRELLVKDKWQGNNLRKVSTLSGGETFLLSLGLALGLSEMTRGQTEVESFFIDEGFGTLDTESISQVLDCLMKMQSRGKQVGLISHVKALTDQIPVRLELEKNNFGESHIELC